MTLTTRRIVGITGLITTALIGLIVVQVLLLEQAYGQKMAVFSRNTEAALLSVVEKLETRETRDRVTDLTLSLGRDGSAGWASLDIAERGSHEQITDSSMIALPDFRPRVEYLGATLILHLSRPERIRLFAFKESYFIFLRPKRLIDLLNPASEYARRFREASAAPEEGTILLDEIKPAGRHEITLDLGLPDRSQYRLLVGDQVYEMKTTAKKIVNLLIRVPVDPLRLALIDKVLEQYLDFERKPVAERIPPESDLGAIVRTTLAEHKIAIPAVVGVLQTVAGTFVKPVSPAFEDGLRASAFRARLFSHDLKAEPYELVLFFPGQRREILAGMAIPAAAAVVFLLITIGCFLITLTALMGQRRFSSRLTDFINNMAHAFKTPLATLSLAGTALGRADVRADEERLARYGRIIGEESERLRRQTERILEMTVMEKTELGLVFRSIDVHDILAQAVERFQPEAEKRGGSIRLIRGAMESLTEADENHLRGAFDNLLDNAFRYNRRPPDILVETSGTGDGIRICIRDNGIGIPPRDLTRVFDKYFRVTRGLQQDTPGFGLGLSYVRWVVDAHGGTVVVRSRIGEGSVFEIDLPLRPGSSRKPRRFRRAGRK